MRREDKSRVDICAHSHYFSSLVFTYRLFILTGIFRGHGPVPAMRSLGWVAACGLSLTACHADVGGSHERADSDAVGGQKPPDSSVPRDDSGGDRDAGEIPTTGCDFTGTFAVRGALDVTWDGTSIANFLPVIAPGTGELTIATLFEVRSEGGSFVATVRACDADIPSFSSDTIMEQYAARFRLPMWDAPGMPSWPLQLHADCFEMGCPLKSDGLNALLGVDLPQPDAAWPTDRKDPQLSFPDQDGDGQPGLTLDMLNEGGFSYPPVNLTTWSRAKTLMLGIRVTMQFDGAFESCDRFSGLGLGSKVETRAATCFVEGAFGSEAECSKTDPPLSVADANFLDGNLPKWTVKSARWTGVRVAAGASCEDVRAAQF